MPSVLSARTSRLISGQPKQEQETKLKQDFSAVQTQSAITLGENIDKRADKRDS